MFSLPPHPPFPHPSPTLFSTRGRMCSETWGYTARQRDVSCYYWTGEPAYFGDYFSAARRPECIMSQRPYCSEPECRTELSRASLRFVACCSFAVSSAPRALVFLHGFVPGGAAALKDSGKKVVVRRVGKDKCKLFCRVCRESRYIQHRGDQLKWSLKRGDKGFIPRPAARRKNLLFSS